MTPGSSHPPRCNQGERFINWQGPDERTEVGFELMQLDEHMKTPRSVI